MIAVDTNLLVHAHRRDAALHDRASAALRGLAESGQPWGICYHGLVEFFAIVTHFRIWRQPSTPAQACDQIAAWREAPHFRLLVDSPYSLDLLARLAIAGAVTGSLTHDARIAACCLDHGVSELWTLDRDFSRFPSLKTCNPLVRPSWESTP